MTDTSTIDLDDDEPAILPDAPRWAVNLHMRLDAPDQADAVEQFMSRTLDYGLRNLVYSVRDREDPDGAMYFVDRGVVFTEEEFNARLQAEEAGGGAAD